MVITLNYHVLPEELPEQSCWVILVAKQGWISSGVEYSSRYKSFNCGDYEESRAHMFNTEDYAGWFYEDEFRKAVQNGR